MSTSAVLAGLAAVREWQEPLYKDLHSNPELSHQEQRTAGIVADRLKDCGFDVEVGIGGTGVAGVLKSGTGPTVLLRADMDALPVKEATGLPYASAAVATDADGNEVPVMHACGHDTHVTCLLGAAQLMADSRAEWSGTLIALFQPAEETADGARGMVDDKLTERIPKPDIALGQHVLAAPAGTVATRSGPVFSAADSMKITVFGRGGHGSMPQTTVDPVVLAAMIVIRLQTVVSREVAPGETAVVTVGSIHAGSKSNVISDSAELRLNIRTFDEATRSTILAAIERIVTAECRASDSPKDPEFELYDRYPLTDNDSDTTAKLASAFEDFFGEHAVELPQVSASEDFGDIPNAFGIPYSYWAFGGIDPKTYAAASDRGRVSQDIPGNHSPLFAPVIQPTLDTGTQALVVAALAYLGS
ncbi:M20 family metallopeptidase [Antrihabitans cavernicola]|uniref:Amidohydrolase n=1 Tax=Antrihabitans cavernicola TaxID=2495913 RepID=A0A5A7SFE7_9NOCA|nr:M20 family metallopeptidase [Spelaeibacter cavernicola]KAA0024850.1 amidohydrolase [Spelaeibacter cavernicola]